MFLSTCSHCCETKPVSEFHQNGSRNGKPRYRSRCKACNNPRFKGRRDPRTAEENRRRNLWKKYRMTPDDFDAMVWLQDNRCAICSTGFSDELRAKNEIHIDHCHETGVVRGLLCGPCNRGLGLFRDSAERMQSAIRYLGA